MCNLKKISILQKVFEKVVILRLENNCYDFNGKRNRIIKDMATTNQ